MGNALQVKDKLFAKELVKNGMNATKAYQAVYPNASYESAKVKASQKFAKDNVKSMVEQFFEATHNNGTTWEHVLSKLGSHSQSDDPEVSLKALNQLRSTLEKVTFAKSDTKTLNVNIHDKKKLLDHITDEIIEGEVD